MHARWNGQKWFGEILDGQGSAVPGSTSNDVGNGLSATAFGDGGIQIFYRDSTNGNLRHAWWPSGGNKWRFETFDGSAGSVGGLNANVGQDPKVIEYNGGLQLFYYDSTNGNLRHAWWPSGGNKWRFETFDGSAGSVGGLNANVGRQAGLGVYNGGLQLFYYDSTNGNLRHAWWPSGGNKWRFETFDGSAGSVIGNNADTGLLPVMQELGGKLNVFYYSPATRSWMGATYDRGWRGFTLDGSASAISGSASPVSGQLAIAAYQGLSLQIFYRDSGGGLKHAWTTK
jgi:hypothetical protein